MIFFFAFGGISSAPPDVGGGQPVNVTYTGGGGLSRERSYVHGNVRIMMVPNMVSDHEMDDDDVEIIALFIQFMGLRK